VSAEFVDARKKLSISSIVRVDSIFNVCAPGGEITLLTICVVNVIFCHTISNKPKR